MIQIVLSTGSNIGNREEHLRAAQLAVAQIGDETMISPVYETEPWGFEDPTAFLNQIIVLKTKLRPEACLDIIETIEKELGRIRYSKNYESRVIDIDIIFYGDEVLKTDRLTIPHPHIADRKFVLAPLNDVLPNFVHPILKKDIRTLLQETPDQGKLYPCVTAT